MNKKIKILFLAANPKNTKRLRLDQEVRAIDQSLRLSEFRDKFELLQHWAVRVIDLQSYLLRHKPNIVHFSGHGSTTSEIILEDDLGNSNSVSRQTLSQLFSVFADEVACVVLNACYSELQARAIATNIDYVVGMSKAIGDQAAISFAKAFYQALGYGKDVKTAFELGCIQIDLESMDDQDIPKLIVSDTPKNTFIPYSQESYLQSSELSTVSTPNDLQQPGFSKLSNSFNVPPLPPLIVGREEALSDLKTQLNIYPDRSSSIVQKFLVVRGWPGIGKTTIAAMLAYEQEISNVFSDGVLWVSLGQKPSILAKLATWARLLGVEDIFYAHTLEEASNELRSLLHDKRFLLIIDDVWEPEHAVPFCVGGQECATLITTRENRVARAIAPTAAQIYKLPGLTDQKALELLEILAPTVVGKYPEESKTLVHELEGLPLAIQVAGHLLNAEASYGFDVTTLLADLHEQTKLLGAKAPVDRTDLVNETIPTVAALLQKSTDRLDKTTRDCFAYLGAFASKPATFDLDAMKSVWNMENPKLIIRALLDRGLLEHIPRTNRYQMHALLVAQAKSLLEEN